MATPQLSSRVMSGEELGRDKVNCFPIGLYTAFDIYCCSIIHYFHYISYRIKKTELIRAFIAHDQKRKKKYWKKAMLFSTVARKINVVLQSLFILYRAICSEIAKA